MVNRPNEMGAERGEEEKTKVHIMPSGQIFFPSGPPTQSIKR